jgi:hypothetical protein
MALLGDGSRKSGCSAAAGNAAAARLSISGIDPRNRPFRIARLPPAEAAANPSPGVRVSRSTPASRRDGRFKMETNSAKGTSC